MDKPPPWLACPRGGTSIALIGVSIKVKKVYFGTYIRYKNSNTDLFSSYRGTLKVIDFFTNEEVLGTLYYPFPYYNRKGAYLYLNGKKAIRIGLFQWVNFPISGKK